MAEAKAKRDSSESLLHQEIEVTIEKMAITGEGVARHQGAVVFIPWAAPGDRLKVYVDFAKKNYFRARIVEIIAPSDLRVTPPCPVAGRCGGCTWQHLSRETQLKQKQSLLQETLNKFLPDLKIEIKSVISSPLEFGYRNRIQPRMRDQNLGFYGWKSHDWIKTSNCLIVEAPLQKFFKTPPVLKKPAQDQKVELYLDTQGNASFRTVAEEQEDQVFSQVNRFQNENLIDYVLDWSRKYKPEKIYDLYAGAGNFSFPLSTTHKSSRVIAVELNRELARQGQLAATEKKISPEHIEFYAMNVDHFLKREVPGPKDLLVLDPPRGGTSEFVLNSIAASGLKAVIYISCSPVSLARDLAFLEKALGPRQKRLLIRQVQAFEMFPQTHHLETIVELGIDSL